MSEGEHLRQQMLAAQQGDKAAYHQLLTEISQLLRHYLRPRISDEEAREDVLQEILIGVHKARADLRWCA